MQPKKNREPQAAPERAKSFWPQRCLVAAAVLLLVTGCQTTQSGGQLRYGTTTTGAASEDPCSHKARNIGIAAGATIGGAAGHVVGEGKTAAILIGAGLGALFGGVIGNNIDQRRCELHRLAQEHNLQMQVQDIQSVQEGKKANTLGLSVSVRDNGGQFASGARKPNAAGAKAFAAIAQSYRQSLEGETPQQTQERLRKMRILLVGHTDDTGSSAGNANLSEARAQAVAEIFAAAGFSKQQIFYQGAGETLPIASNAAEEGRALNRRVEIVDLSDDNAFNAYLAGRRANTEFYRSSAQASVTGAGGAATTSASGRKPSRKGSAAAPSKAGTAATARKGDAPAARQPAGTAGNTTTTAQAPTPRKGATATGPARLPAGKRSGPEIDFGGQAIVGQATVVGIGAVQQSGSTFPWLSTAQANETAPLGSCLHDRPRVSHGVKSLSTNELRTTDYLPGMYSSSWIANVNGHLVALNHVAVLRDGALPARKPDLLIYTNYTNDGQAKPAWRSSPEVNTYNGEKGILYRVFASGPVQCMDILIPHQNPRQAPGSNLIYPKQGDYFQVTFAPALAK